MRFPLKLALSAVLAKTIVGQSQPTPNEQSAQVFNPIPQDAEINYTGKEDHSGNLSPYYGYPAQDVVQQYASAHQNPSASLELPGVVTDLSVNGFIGPQYPAGNNQGVYHQDGYDPSAYNPGRFTVQKSYEGFLVPEPRQAPQTSVVEREPPTFFSPLSSTINALTGGFPEPMRQMMRQTSSFLGRSFSLLLRLIGLTVFGGGLTTLICTFTPLCTITFAAPLLALRSSAKDLAEAYVGPKNAEMFDRAMEKFANMQLKEKERLAAKSGPSDDVADIKNGDATKTDDTAKKA